MKRGPHPALAALGGFLLEVVCRWTGTDLTHWLKDRERPSLAYEWTDYEERRAYDR